MLNVDSAVDRVRRGVTSSDSAKLVNMDVWYATTLWLALISGWIDPASGRRSRSNPNGEIVVKPVVPPALLVPPSTDESYYVPNKPGIPHPQSAPEHDYRMAYPPRPHHRRQRLWRRSADDSNVQLIRAPRAARYHPPRHPAYYSSPESSRYPIQSTLMSQGDPDSQMASRGMHMTTRNHGPPYGSRPQNPFESLGQLPSVSVLPPSQNQDDNDDPWSDLYGDRQRPMASPHQPPNQWGRNNEAMPRANSAVRQRSRANHIGTPQNGQRWSSLPPGMGHEFINPGHGLAYEVSLTPSRHHRARTGAIGELSESTGNIRPRQKKRNRNRLHAQPTSHYIPSESEKYNDIQGAGPKGQPLKRSALTAPMKFDLSEEIEDEELDKKPNIRTIPFNQEKTFSEPIDGSSDDSFINPASRYRGRPHISTQVFPGQSGDFEDNLFDKPYPPRQRAGQPSPNERRRQELRMSAQPQHVDQPRNMNQPRYSGMMLPPNVDTSFEEGEIEPRNLQREASFGGVDQYPYNDQ